MTKKLINWLKSDLGCLYITKYKLQAFTVFKFAVMLLVAQFYDWEMTILSTITISFIYLVFSGFAFHRWERKIAVYKAKVYGS